MSDDTKTRDVRDRTRISMTEDYEVNYWTNALGCTREQLQHAINQVGNSAETVRDFLGRSN
jgi:hypothetical protein